tara:strand:- start:17706 stop:17978 length:273 start_codon:yes stop_codon:yes gene_type:complete
MGHRRKRSKGSTLNPVKGARVINKGGGGGEAKRGRSLEQAQTRAAGMKEARHLLSGDVVENARKKFLALRKKQTVSGKKRNLTIIGNAVA